MAGFFGCLVANLVLAMAYYQLKDMNGLFVTVYICQLCFQQLPGVTTMAIPAEIFPSAVKGTGAAISAASGKLGATFGSFFFTMLKDQGSIRAIFWTVAGTAAAALVLTMLLIPKYNGLTLDQAGDLAAEGKTREAVKMLYSGPQRATKGTGDGAEASGKPTDDGDVSGESSA